MKGTLLGLDVLLIAIIYIIYAILTVKRNYIKIQKATLNDYKTRLHKLDHQLLIVARCILVLGLLLILGMFLI